MAVETTLEFLRTYGVLGIWTSYQIYKETTFHKEMITTLNGLKDVIGSGRK